MLSLFFLFSPQYEIITNFDEARGIGYIHFCGLHPKVSTFQVHCKPMNNWLQFPFDGYILTKMLCVLLMFLPTIVTFETRRPSAVSKFDFTSSATVSAVTSTSFGVNEAECSRGAWSYQSSNHYWLCPCDWNYQWRSPTSSRMGMVYLVQSMIWLQWWRHRHLEQLH